MSPRSNTTIMKNKQKKAFTLIELIIVIVILGILAAIAVVGYQAIVNRSKDTGVEQAATSFARELKALAAFDEQGDDLGTWVDYMDAADAEGDLAGLDVTPFIYTAAADVDAADFAAPNVDGSEDDDVNAFLIEKGNRETIVLFGSATPSGTASHSLELTGENDDPDVGEIG